MKRSAGNVWHRFACAVLIALGAQMAAADVLLWEFDDSDIIAQDGKTTLHVDELASGDKKANAIRVKQVSGKDESYLLLSYADLTGEVTIGKTWFLNDDFLAGPGYARFGEVDVLDKFMIEIGNLTNEDWTPLAASEALTYSQLDKLKHIWHDEVTVPSGEREWNGGVFCVPEPSGALLLLLGGACVALRRRRREVAFK